ncbi:MAG TPA: hypothetical protein VG318_07385 [Actinomycetota bacterium]|nr:hypothetical protein [Actinomycetota bacterium]
MSSSDNPLPGSLGEQIKGLFAYRAESLEDRLFDLFAEPIYLPALTTARPCVLIGGRGTGKTTVLRGLSYEGQHALRSRRRDEAAPSGMPFFGLYLRIHTGRLHAFQGADKTPEQWSRLFAHFFNLIVCQEILKLALWQESLDETPIQLSSDAIDEMAIAAGLGDSPEPITDIGTLARSLRRSLKRFQAHLNDETEQIAPTVLGAPIEEFFDQLSRVPAFEKKLFFILVDEYENFLDYQQRIVNTLLKHSTPPYSFKIGVRELGWRDRAVMGGQEKVTSPADYERIDIATAFREDTFRDFAVRVCNERLEKLATRGGDPLIRDIRRLLPPLSLEEEAERFGVRERAHEVIAELTPSFSEGELAMLKTLNPLQVYLFRYWSEATGQSMREQFSDFVRDRRKWETRYVNYKYAMIFTLRKKRAGFTFNKFYAGWDTYLQMSSRNIRYFLMLVEKSLISDVIEEGRNLTSPVRPETQTVAAQAVGRLNLEELEGVDVFGPKLARLVLGLGRVFQVMARNPSGHTPEVNQFYLREDLEAIAEQDVGVDVDGVRELLTAAVTHLALLRSPGTKLLDEASIRHHDYMLHPVYAAFFEFSTRRKRKMQVTLEDLRGIVLDPRPTIRSILTRSRRVAEDDLPDQLLLFESFYREAS